MLLALNENVSRLTGAAVCLIAMWAPAPPQCHRTVVQGVLTRMPVLQSILLCITGPCVM